MYREITDYTPQEKLLAGFRYPGFEFVGVLVEYSNTMPILKGSFTPPGCVRDMGKYWIIARADRYDRLTKARHFIKYDVEDK